MSTTTQPKVVRKTRSLVRVDHACMQPGGITASAVVAEAYRARASNGRR